MIQNRNSCDIPRRCFPFYEYKRNVSPRYRSYNFVNICDTISRPKTVHILIIPSYLKIIDNLYRFSQYPQKKKETKISTRNFIQKKTIYFPSLFPILIYSPEIVTKNQTNFTYRKETEYHQIMLKRKFPRNTSKFPHLIRSNKGWSKVKEEEKKKDASSKADIESTI